MILPNLIIVGAAKSGTTSLHNYLNQHPDVFMCDPKEPHFLINKEIGLKRIPIAISDINDYEKLFLGYSDIRYRGESSVMYLMYPEIVIPKIKSLLGEETRIIIMLRNPVDRAYSGYYHLKRYNIKENKDFETAWDISEERYFNNEDMPPSSRYKELGMYHSQVKSYLDNMMNVHVIIYDDYKDNFDTEMNKVFNFLDIPPIKIDTHKKHMVGGWEWQSNKVKRIMMSQNILKSLMKIFLPFRNVRRMIRNFIRDISVIRTPEMDISTRSMLNRFYKKDVHNLSNLLGRDLNHWVK